MCYCPKCEAPTSVESKINAATGNGIKRNRKCTNEDCAHRFSTIEFPYDAATIPIVLPLLEMTRKAPR